MVNIKDVVEIAGVSAVTVSKVLNFSEAVSKKKRFSGLGAIKAIEEEGCKIPEDISIIDFNDIYTSKFLAPSLTVISQPIYEIGIKAAEILLDRIKKKRKKFIPKKIVVPGKLTIRESVS